MRRLPLILLVLPVLALGCLADVDLDPRGYACQQDQDCAPGLVCVENLCAEVAIVRVCDLTSIGWRSGHLSVS